MGPTGSNRSQQGPTGANRVLIKVLNKELQNLQNSTLLTLKKDHNSLQNSTLLILKLARPMVLILARENVVRVNIFFVVLGCLCFFEIFGGFSSQVNLQTLHLFIRCSSTSSIGLWGVLGV